MAVGPTGSTVPRRQLGRNLRELRARASMTVRAAAGALEWSETKIWRIETGQTPLRALDVETMCRVYGAGGDLTAALMGLARETKARGWWHAYGDLIPEGFDVYVGLEEAAVTVSTYESDIVPGLLQTDGYIREITRVHYPDIKDDDLDGRVRLRIERQGLLTRATDPATVRVALSETVLRRRIGGGAVMAQQLAHLVYVSSLPNVAIRIVPLAIGAHQGMVSGPFVILRFPVTGAGVDTEPPTVYADGYTGGLYLDKPGEVQQYDRAFSGIWNVALDELESLRLISDVAGSYREP
ncbi:helix-turn-helix domain-containing protein [Streptomyces uncialis]|uniref:helix-turn-helix domain-containing protein n=1 Tax=Streptomyces uncialis TaxID=1048205 RepID=UPI0037B58015